MQIFFALLYLSFKQMINYYLPRGETYFLKEMKFVSSMKILFYKRIATIYLLFSTRIQIFLIDFKQKKHQKFTICISIKSKI